MREVYAALYELDKGLSARFTSIQDGINGLHERMTTHEAQHAVNERQEAVETEVKLDAKKAGVAGLFAAIGAAVAAIATVIKQSL